MTIHELIKLAIKKLSTSTSPSLDGEVLLSYVLDKPKEYLMTNPDQTVSVRLEKQFKILLDRRLSGEPVAYLRNEKEFYDLRFYVDKNVLVPRPETEGLVDLTISEILKYTKKRRSSNFCILDIGTGSGNIIISLAKYLESNVAEGFSLPKNGGLKASATKNQYYASDISSKAIAIAKKNAKLHKVKIKFAIGNLLEPWDNQNFDAIIANLPYLSRRTDPSTKFEPIGALIAAKKGLDLYEKLFKQVANIPLRGAKRRGNLFKGSPRDLLSLAMAMPQYLFLEIGRDQSRLIKKLAAKWLPAYQTKIFKDLAQRPRFAVLALGKK